MKKLLAVFCALVLIFTTAFAALPVVVSAVSAPEGQNRSEGSTILCSSMPSKTELLDGLYGRRIEIAGISKLTDNSSIRTLGYKCYKNYIDAEGNATAAFDFPAGTTLAASGGFMFYVDLPVLNSHADKDVPIPHTLYITLYDAMGAETHYTYSMEANAGIAWYVLPDGEYEWQAENEWRDDGEYDYGLIISDGTKHFKGYVYIPSALFRQKSAEAVPNDRTAVSSVSVVVDPDRMTGNAELGRTSERGVAPIEISAISIMTSFNSANTSAYNDKGELVDLAKKSNPVELCLPYFEDEKGDEYYFHAGNTLGLPGNLSNSDFSIVKNESIFPLEGILSIGTDTEKSSIDASYNLSEEIKSTEVKGAIFYVEVPDFGTVSHTYENGTTYETDLFRFGVHFGGYEYKRDTVDANGDGELDYLYNPDGSRQTVSKYYYTYAGDDWYIRGVNDTSWTSGAKEFYGIQLKSGFKGYVCIPFNSLTQDAHNITADSVITGVTIRQLKSTTDVFYADSNNKVYYGYVPVGDSLKISEPIWISGDYTEGTEELYTAKTVEIDGVEYNFTDGKITDYKPTEEIKNSFAKVTVSGNATTDGSDNNFGVKSYVASNTVLTYKDSTFTDGARVYEAGNVDNDAVALRNLFENPIAYDSISSSNGGFMFYAVIPKVEGVTVKVQPYIKGINVADAVVTRWVDTNLAADVTVYTLKDGETSWTALRESESAFANANAVNVGGGEAWSGYIFVPISSLNNHNSGTGKIVNITEFRVAFDANRYTTSGGAYDVDITTSSAMLVSGFNAASTIITTDYKETVNLSTGKKVDFDYYSPNEYYGNADAINNGKATVMAIDTLPTDKVAIVGNTPDVITAGSLKTGAKYVESISPITKMPAINFAGTVTTSRGHGIQYDFGNYDIMADEVDGLLVPIRINNNKPLSLGLMVATRITSDGGTTYTSDYSTIHGFWSTFRILSADTGEWADTVAAKPVAGVTQLPVGFNGYLYISKFGTMVNELAQIFALNFYIAGDEDNLEADFDLGPVMTVRNGTFTENYAGLAFVNGNTVAENILDGSFKVANDVDGDMNVSLIDLVRAKNEQTENEFTAFRLDYITEYYPVEKEKSEAAPVSFNNTLLPLNSSKDALISNNPDRGYRNEMALRIEEKLDEGETADVRMLYTTDSEAKIRETMNTLFDIYLPATAEYDSKLILAFISFNDWNKAESLPAEVINILEIFFEYLRKYEVKALLRFSYGVPTNKYIANEADREYLATVCADEATMIRHIKQLSSIVGKNRDVVHKVSSGWIGNGEMVAAFQWPAVNFDNIVRAVVENMCVPYDLYFTVRLPRYEVDMLNNYKAANGIDYPYSDIIGFNNDALFGEQSNSGWHSGCYQINHINCTDNGTICFMDQPNYLDEWAYGIKNAAYTPQSGEMFTNTNLFETGRIPTGMQVMLEMAHHRYTSFSQWHGYLENSHYQEDGSNVISKWINEENYTAADIDAAGLTYDPAWFKDDNGNDITRNPFEILRDHLGYKLVASNTSFSWNGERNSNAKVSLSLKNYGYAAPFMLESGFAILDENYNAVSRVKVGDPDKWYNLHPDYYTDEYEKTGTANDNVITYNLSGELTVPSADGKYYVAFFLQNSSGKGAHLSNDVDFRNEFNIIGEFTK